jgi:hypothetical protein
MVGVIFGEEVGGFGTLEGGLGNGGPFRRVSVMVRTCVPEKRQLAPSRQPEAHVPDRVARCSNAWPGSPWTVTGDIREILRPTRN